MPFGKIKWPKSEEKSKLGIGGVCHGDAVPQCTDPVRSNFKLVVQPLDKCDKRNRSEGRHSLLAAEHNCHKGAHFSNDQLCSSLKLGRAGKG